MRLFNTIQHPLDASQERGRNVPAVAIATCSSMIARRSGSGACTSDQIERTSRGLALSHQPTIALHRLVIKLAFRHCRVTGNGACLHRVCRQLWLLWLLWFGGRSRLCYLSLDPLKSQKRGGPPLRLLAHEVQFINTSVRCGTPQVPGLILS